jgi:hypothetical protein
VSIGDYNGDGNSAILLQNTNGEIKIWNQNGTDVNDSAEIGNPGPSWRVIGAGDGNPNR